MPPTKRQKPNDHDHNTTKELEGQSSESEDASMDSQDESASASSELDTDTEITLAQQPRKSKKTAKRKRRAVSPTPFARALNTLLNTEVPNNLPLSLRPAVAKERNEEKLEMRAKKLLLGQKKEREEKGRIKDVIGGWGGESERALRKVAQRGVVKLFNTIQQVQSNAEQAQAALQTKRGTGKPTLPAPQADAFGKDKTRKKGSKHKDNILGREKEVNLGQDAFMDLIRSGGTVSKT